ncbi:MAG: hypothetical protein B6I20_13415 [Bacteroidetes bacterium 4572_117]|nr:MAG: hypothetical protein B6I20_13415 [Bacteroidetes bacterium 4572_117]
MKLKLSFPAFVFCFYLLFSAHLLQAQSVKIETTNLEIKNNQLFITYNFVKSKSSHSYNVWVEITKSTGEKINAKSLSGDIGPNIQGAESKQIIWDYNKDGIILDDEIDIEVIADITINDPRTGKAILLSSILPGLGLSKVDPGKPYWLMGVVGYSLIGGSVIFNKAAVANFNDYTNSEDPVISDDLYATSADKDKMSKICAFSAIGLWAGNIIWTAIKAKNSQNAITGRFNKKQKVLFYGGLDPKTKSAGFTLKYRF